MFDPRAARPRVFFLFGEWFTESGRGAGEHRRRHTLQETSMSIRLPHCGAAVALVLLTLALPPLAEAAKKAAPAQGTQRPPTKVTFIDAPPSESPAAREKRLKRECKGRPNAGMCLGHTR
jgi:hypothetical protein